MIELIDIHKSYPSRYGKLDVLKGINLRINQGEVVGILGGNGAGKSTLIRLMSGIDLPTSGLIKREMRISWTLGFTGAFQGSLTGYDNMRFICRVYETDFDEKVDFVREFSELGRFLNEPVKTYSSGMRARLGFALSMIVEFDCYLIDEVMTVGDSRFRDRCHDELFVKRADRAKIIVSHEAHFVREHCTLGCVLSNGFLKVYDTIDEASAVHEHNMRAQLI
jgi:capsular polysaccharide transport system ATP-binding protein